MASPARYARLFLAFARFGLAQEMAFRANFLIKLVVEAMWLAILLFFYDVVFKQTDTVAGWSREQYLFFVGCHYTLSGTIETFFLENCTGFSELVRTGDLDRFLLRPIDEQFLITTRQMDWSTFPNVLQGVGVMVYALWAMGWHFDPYLLLLFAALFLCGVAMAYGFLLMLASASVWMVRNQSLLELWWLFTTLMRYPREIFGTSRWAQAVGWFLTYVVPVLIVVSVPAEAMVDKLSDWRLAAMMGAFAVLTLAVSRWFFRYSLRAYRSASS